MLAVLPVQQQQAFAAVPEQTIRSKVDDVIQRFPSDERGRLKAILSFWVMHNKQNSDKFRKWAQKTEEMKNDPIYKSVLNAASEIEEANKKLSQLWNEL